MLEGYLMPRGETHYNTEKHKDYIIEDEGLFQPDGRYLDRPVSSYFRRLEKKLQPLPNAPDLQKQQAKWAIGQLESWTHELKQQGWPGVAKAHSLLSAFDIVQRKTTVKGATAFISSPFNGTNDSVLEVLLSVPPEVLEDESSRELWTKEFTETTLNAIDRIVPSLDR